MPLTEQERDTLIDAISRLGQDDAPGDADEPTPEPEAQPQTAMEAMTAVMRDVLRQAGVISDDTDDDDAATDDDDSDDAEPLEVELELAALRHVVASRFPDLDIDAELALVTGLELSDDGEVTGEASYEPSDAMRGTVRSRRGRRQPNPKTARRSEPKSLADMDVHEFAARMSEEGIEDARQLFESASLMATGQSNAKDELVKTVGRGTRNGS